LFSSIPEPIVIRSRSASRQRPGAEPAQAPRRRLQQTQPHL